MKRYLSQGRLPVEVLKRLSLYREDERRAEIRHCALFWGDIPARPMAPAVGLLSRPGAGEGPENFVCANDYVGPSPVREEREGVLYTAEGVAFHRGAVEESLSARKIRGAWPFLRYPSKSRARRFAQGTIIQAEHARTYGDWVSEHAKSLALAGEIPMPLILPAHIGRRPYVGAELGRLGIEFVSIDAPVFIDKACVLLKPRPTNFWNRDDVAAYRRLFGIAPHEPRRGSILYLSREGARSELSAVTRSFRSRACAEAVEEMGGRVVETGGLGMEDFAALADSAETVVADHGAAMFNMLQWNVRNVVEIVTDNWWNNCFVFLGVACGVRNHAIVRCDPRSDEEFKTAIRGHLERCRAA